MVIRLTQGDGLVPSCQTDLGVTGAESLPLISWSGRRELQPIPLPVSVSLIFLH